MKTEKGNFTCKLAMRDGTIEATHIEKSGSTQTLAGLIMIVTKTYESYPNVIYIDILDENKLVAELAMIANMSGPDVEKSQEWTQSRANRSASGEGAMVAVPGRFVAYFHD